MVAIGFLEAAIRDDTGRWEDLNDLGVAHYLAAQADDPTHLLDGLDAIRAGLALAPDVAPLRFNEALFLTDMGLDEPAAVAWRAFLHRDPPAGWREEALDTLRSLRLAAPSDAWRADLGAALRQRDLARVERVVVENPSQDIVAYAHETVLAEWARAEMKGDERAAREHLGCSKVLGASIHRTTGDAFVSDFTDQAETLDAVSRRALARAYLGFITGRSSYDRRETESARRALAGARRSMGGVDGPLAHWIDYFSLLCEVWRSGDGAPLPQLEHLGDQVDAHRYPILAAYMAWSRGFLQIDKGRFDEGLASYEAARRGFTAAGQDDPALTLSALISDGLQRLGETRRAWREALDASRGSRDLRSDRHRWAAWDQAAQVASLLGHSEIASDFYGQAIDAAVSASSTTTACNAYVNRAMHLSRSGRLADAQDDLRHARGWANRIE